MFYTYPVPKEYIPQISSKSGAKQGRQKVKASICCILQWQILHSNGIYVTKPYFAENDLTKYLAETKKSDNNVPWLEKCKKHFCSVLTSRSEQPRGTGEYL